MYIINHITLTWVHYVDVHLFLRDCALSDELKKKLNCKLYILVEYNDAAIANADIFQFYNV